MDTDQPGQYRVVERDGRLVVEPREKPPRRYSARWKFKLPRISPNRIGLWLFQELHSYELTEDGFAIISAESLQHSITLDARSYDLYYLTQAQQSALGWNRVIGWVPIVVAFLFPLAVLADSAIAWFVGIVALACLAAGWKAYADQLESIHGQRFEPDV